jgi:tRNA threonylcarbamoyladenosine biosynthesis protein TsaB
MVYDGEVVASVRHAPGHGLPAALPLLIGQLISEAGRPDLVAVVVGPGSFTGLRAGLSVAQGIGIGADVPVVGVSAAEALAMALPAVGDRSLWIALESRRGRIFLDRDGDLAAFALDVIPRTASKLAIAGDAANDVAAIMAARGNDVMLTSARHPLPRHVALIGERRAAGELPPMQAVPMYVDAPEAKLPAGGLRPPPQ